MMKLSRFAAVIGFACALSVALAYAQEGPPQQISRHKSSQPAVGSGAPVTKSEARAILKKLAALLPSVALHPLRYSPEMLPNSSAPVTRVEVIEGLGRMFEGLRPYFKFTPQPVWFDPSLLTVKDKRTLATLEKLIRFGFISRVSRIAASNQENVSVDDFGDEVGFFVARAAYITHMPLTDYSPYLEKP